MFTNLFYKHVRLLLLHKLLKAIPCAECAECTVTGYVAGALYCHLRRICLVHSYRICYRCSLLSPVQNVLSAQLPDVTGAPYCNVCRMCLVHSYRICYRCSLLSPLENMLSAVTGYVTGDPYCHVCRICTRDTVEVLLTANCAKFAEHSASQKLQSCVKYEITWNFSVKNLAYVSMPTMAYRFSAKNMATETARIRQIVSFRQFSNVRPE
jgi:hypothetical protein